MPLVWSPSISFSAGSEELLGTPAPLSCSPSSRTYRLSGALGSRPSSLLYVLTQHDGAVDAADTEWPRRKRATR